MSPLFPTATMRPPSTATAPSSITRRDASIVTTVPPLTIKSTRAAAARLCAAACAGVSRIMTTTSAELSLFINTFASRLNFRRPETGRSLRPSRQVVEAYDEQPRERGHAQEQVERRDFGGDYLARDDEDDDLDGRARAVVEQKHPQLRGDCDEQDVLDYLLQYVVLFDAREEPRELRDGRLVRGDDRGGEDEHGEKREEEVYGIADPAVDDALD